MMTTAININNRLLSTSQIILKIVCIIFIIVLKLIQFYHKDNDARLPHRSRMWSLDSLRNIVLWHSHLMTALWWSSLSLNINKYLTIYEDKWPTATSPLSIDSIFISIACSTVVVVVFSRPLKGAMHSRLSNIFRPSISSIVC